MIREELFYLCGSNPKHVVGFRVQIFHDVKEELLRSRIHEILRESNSSTAFSMRSVKHGLFEFSVPMDRWQEREEEVIRAMRQVDEEIEQALKMQNALKMLGGAND